MSTDNGVAASAMLDRVWKISKRLDQAGISHERHLYRYDGVSILAHVPGQYWEIDILDDGSVDLEVYKSVGLSEDSTAELDQLIEEWSEPETDTSIQGEE